MSFGVTPVDTSSTPIPMSSAVPDGSTTPSAIAGGPSYTDSGNTKVPVSIWVKDGNDVALGLTTDAAVVGDNSGTASAKLRGLSKILNDIWDSVNHLFHQNLKQVGGNAVVTGGANGLLAVGGPVASGGANADNPLKVGGVFNTAQPTVTNGQIVDLQSTARGAQIVATGVDPLSVSGMVASGSANANNPLKTGGAFNTTQPTVTNGQVVDAQMTARGAQIVASGVDALTVQPGNTANTTPWLITQQVSTTGGSTPSHTMSAASTNATSLKGSAGQVYGLDLSNVNAAARYFKLYDKASAPTVGTDTPKKTIQIPANGTVIRAFPVGLVFTLGIAWAMTGGITDADTTAIGANDCSIDIDYK